MGADVDLDGEAETVEAARRLDERIEAVQHHLELELVEPGRRGLRVGWAFGLGLVRRGSRDSGAGAGARAPNLLTNDIRSYRPSCAWRCNTERSVVPPVFSRWWKKTTEHCGSVGDASSTGRSTTAAASAAAANLDVAAAVAAAVVEAAASAAVAAEGLSGRCTVDSNVVAPVTPPMNVAAALIFIGWSGRQPLLATPAAVRLSSPRAWEPRSAPSQPRTPSSTATPMYMSAAPRLGGLFCAIGRCDPRDTWPRRPARTTTAWRL